MLDAATTSAAVVAVQTRRYSYSMLLAVLVLYRLDRAAADSSIQPVQHKHCEQHEAMSSSAGSTFLDEVVLSSIALPHPRRYCQQNHA